jgi:hypothetical protein
MSKRFTATEKWADPWFQGLPPALKCAWVYILDNCDTAGIWVVNERLLAFQVGKGCTWANVKKTFGERLIEFSPGRVWVPKFIAFQYGTLHEAAKPHQKVISLLKGFGLYEAYLSKGYPKGIDTLQEEDKDQDQEGKKKGDARGKQKPASEFPPPVLAVYAFWKRHFKASARKADALKWISRRGDEVGFERLIMAVNAYRLECNAKHTEEKFWKECANFFGEDAAFEGFLPSPEIYEKHLAKATAELNGGANGHEAA